MRRSCAGWREIRGGRRIWSVTICRRSCAVPATNSPACRARQVYRDLQRGKLSYRMHRFTKDSSDIHPTVLTTHLTGWISHRPKGHWRGFAGLREALAWTRWRQSGG
jgi:hypothetical protein